MAAEIQYEDMPISGPMKPIGDLARPQDAGSARVLISWRRFTDDQRAADTVRVGVVVDYDLSQSILDKRRQARARLAEILEQAAADLKAWRDPNDPLDR